MVISFIAVACSLAPVACCVAAACSSADELCMRPTDEPTWRVSARVMKNAIPIESVSAASVIRISARMPWVAESLDAWLAV